MATNLAIDDALINSAVKVGHHATKKAAVTEALKEYIKGNKQMEVINLFGAIVYDKKYHYKKQRKRASHT